MIFGFSKFSVGWAAREYMKESKLLKMKDADSTTDPYLELMTLSQFIVRYHDEIVEVTDRPEHIKEYSDMSRSEVLVLCDTSNSYHSMSKTIRNKYTKRAHMLRRERMREQYDYRINIFNRIHGYCCLTEMPSQKNSGLEHRKILSISIIATSCRSNRSGVGTYLLKTVNTLASYAGYTDIVLEVANDVVESEESEIDIEYPTCLSDEDVEQVTNSLENLIECISDKLWKQGMRHVKEISERTGIEHTVAYHNVDKDYITGFLDTYFLGITECHLNGYNNANKYFKSFGGYTMPTHSEYGGKEYLDSIYKMSRLIKWYERMGFSSAPYVNYEWKMFTKTPYHAMRLELLDNPIKESFNNIYEVNGMIFNRFKSLDY